MFLSLAIKDYTEGREDNETVKQWVILTSCGRLKFTWFCCGLWTWEQSHKISEQNIHSYVQHSKRFIQGRVMGNYNPRNTGYKEGIHPEWGQYITRNHAHTSHLFSVARFACFWKVGGTWRTQRKPTETRKHALKRHTQSPELRNESGQCYPRTYSIIFLEFLFLLSCVILFYIWFIYFLMSIHYL